MSNNQNNNNNQNTQQNNQQGSLLRRTTNNANNNNQNNNNNSLRTRLSNNNNRFGNNNQQPPQPPQQPPKPTWTVTPLGTVGIKFAFQGIGDPLFRILGTPLDTSLKDAEVFATKLADDESLHQKLMDKLDEAWESYQFYGAVIMHPVRKNIQDAFTQPPMPAWENDQQADNDNANNTNNNTPSPFQTQVDAPYDTYRAVDAIFVLNILGRVRGNVLVEETPLALEVGFLKQSYICDDPRLVDLALATGAIEESW